MSQKAKNPSEDENAYSHSFSDEATSNKIEKHLSDINDVISDEDIRNVKVNTGPQDAEVAGKTEKSVMNNKKTTDNSLEDRTDEDEEGKKINTPWNLLDEH